MKEVLKYIEHSRLKKKSSEYKFNYIIRKTIPFLCIIKCIIQPF